MDTTVYPTDTDLLHVLVPLVPAGTLQATLDELGLGSVPHNRLLQDALVRIMQTVPSLQTRLLGPLHVTLEQAAAMLRTTPATMRRLVQAAIIPLEPSGNGTVPGQVISGDLVRISISRGSPVGGFTGWRPLMPVTIWSVTKEEQA